MNDSRDYWMELLESVQKIKQEELARANERYPMFSSMHEGYATLLEEYDETCDELAGLEGAMTHLWNAIKDNRLDLTSFAAGRIELGALNLACESIQCAAMAHKIIDSQKLLDNQPE